MVLDNCTTHHSKSAKQLAQELNIELLYLKPYSPETNPIELYWAQVKALFRKDLTQAYVDGAKSIYLRELLVPALQHPSLEEIRAYVKKAESHLFS